MLSCEYECIRLPLVLCVFKHELHADLLKLWILVNYYPLDEIELISSVGISVEILNSFENEDLIGLLLSFNQVFARNNSQEVLAIRNLHTDDLVLLSADRLKQRHLYFALLDLSKSVDVKELDGVNFRDQKGVHRLYWKPS